MDNPGEIAGHIGTPLTSNATKVLLLGSGELGKQLAMSFQNLALRSTLWTRMRARRRTRWRSIATSPILGHRPHPAASAGDSAALCGSGGRNRCGRSAGGDGSA